MDNTVKQDFDSAESLKLHVSLLMFKHQLIFFSVFFILFLFFYFQNPQIFLTDLFTIWATTCCLSLITGFILNHIFVTGHHITNSLKKIYAYIFTLISGLLCSFAFLTVNLAYFYTTPFNNLLTIITLTLVLVSMHISATVHFTYDYRFFLTFIIPAFIPLITTKLPFDSITYQLAFFTGLYIYAGLILYLGYAVNQNLQKNLKYRLQLKASQLESQHKDSEILELKQKVNDFKDQQELEIQNRIASLTAINLQLESSHQNLELAHETAGLASWDWDIQNRVVQANNFFKLFGYTITSVNHYISYLHDYVHPDDIELVKKEMRDHLRNFTERYEAIYRVHHQTDGWVWVHDLGKVIQRHPKSNIPLRMVGIRRNIQHEKSNEEQLTLSLKIFKKLNQGIFILDTKLAYTNANSYFLDLIGMTENQLLGRYIFDISKGNRADLQKMHLNVLKQLMNKGSFEGEIFEEFNNGKHVPLYVDINPIYDAQNRLTQYVGLVTDLTERKDSEERVSYLENYDTLTDLPNRHYFNKKLHDYLNNNVRFVNKIAVLRVNLDRFRYYNELLNQHGGDELLKEVAKRLRHVSSDAAVVARLNSDDFAVIWEIKNSTNEVTTYCKRLIQAFDNAFKINQHEFIMTLSIGIAFFPDHGRQMDSLNIHAELALLEAKRVGGNAVRIYHNDKQISSEPRLKLENELRKAIHNKELILYFQPKLCSKTLSISGFEALIRWNHPRHGIILPAQFIPLAEETSLISDIGHFVIEMACAQIKKWYDLGFKDINVSVNVVAQQLNRGHLIEEIDYMIKKYGISPHQLELEITETSLMENNENVRKVMEQLQQRNINVSLDDFGIGYSSLAYLTQYSFEIIKIDRSFICGIGVSNKDAIVRAMIAMAKAMGKKVVAEGIETQAHYDFLIQEGCDYLQGYLIGKPMPADMATAMLQDSYKIHL